MNRYISKKFIAALLKSSPKSAATVSKLVEPDDDSEASEKGYGHDELSTEYFSAPEHFASNYQATLDALKLFPDLELAAGIYASLVVSSGDLATNKMVVSSNETLLLPDIKAKLLRIIESELTVGYDLVGNLDEILIELMVGKGSVVRVTIPENSLDDFINGRTPFNRQVAMEADDLIFETDNTIKDLGILGSIGDKRASGAALEDDADFFSSKQYKARLTRDFTLDTVEIIDNYHCLKYPALKKVEATSSLESILYPSIESCAQTRTSESPEPVKVEGDLIMPDDVDGPRIRRKDIFSRVKVEESKVSEIHSDPYSTRESITRPLTFEIPAESIIPVITPGKPESAKGYFVMLDDSFNFLTLETRKCDKEKSVEQQLESGKVDSELKSKISDLLGANTKDKQKRVGNVAFQRFKAVIERDMADRLNTGIHGGTAFEITENPDIEYLMFLRALAGKKTKLLFLPAEMVAYYAINRDDQGIGKNVIADMKELNNMRGTLLFSEVYAVIKNNLRTTNVELTLEPSDPQPEKTIRLATAEVMKTRAMDLPTSMSSLSQLPDWIQRAGFQFSFKNHPGLPQVEFDFSDQTITRDVGNNEDTIEGIRAQQFNAFGLTPEVVDTGLDVNFATTDQANRKFLLKRVRKTRGIISRTLTGEAHHIVRSDPHITKQILTVLDGVKVKDPDGKELSQIELYNAFLNGLVVGLPNLEEDNNIKTQSELYGDYVSALDVALEAWLNPEMYDRSVFGDDLPDLLETLKHQIRGHYLREYQTKTGYFSELGDMTTLDSNGDSFLKMGDLIPEHVTGILNTTKDFYKGLKKENKSMTKLIEEIRAYIENEDPEEDEDSGETDIDGNPVDESGDAGEDAPEGTGDGDDAPDTDTKGTDEPEEETSGGEGSDEDGEGKGIAGLPKLPEGETPKMEQPDEKEPKE